MRILMLGWELPPHNSGGLGVACYYMSKALAQKGASIDFILPYRATHDAPFMQVHSATQLDPRHRHGMVAYNSPGHATDISAVQSLYTQYVLHHLKTHTPQIIHAHDWLTIPAGILAKKASDAPLIVHVHATEYDRSGELYGNPLVHDIEQEGLIMADRIIAVSNITKQLIIDKYHIPADKIEVIHNSIDIHDLGNHIYDTSTYLYLEMMKREGYKVVSSIGRLTIQKGLTYLLEAAARASEKSDNLLFLFVGDGEQRDELIHLSAELGISDKVFFTGFIRGQSWRDAYSVSDMFVMSSVSEPFGLTALEASAHHTAIILSKQSGVGEVLQNALRFDYWDTDKLADIMVNVAHSESLQKSLQDNAFHEFTHFSWTHVADKIHQTYQHVSRSFAHEVTI